MLVGRRLIYSKNDGVILNSALNAEGELITSFRPKEIDYIDLPYGYIENNFNEAIEYHIDVTKDKNTATLKDLIIITKYREHIETEEEKLKREKQELENQLLLQADKNIGGIL